MPQPVAVPDNILAKLRLACLDLPEAYEESAWVGTRWMVAKKNFAHVLMIDGGWPPAYARAAQFRRPALRPDFSPTAADARCASLQAHAILPPCLAPDVTRDLVFL